ncbi:alpha,Alpha-Phosphotrehalase [Arthrobacter sp. Hiyo8]|nr:alpha,Alpha-Phosphotrehalase [Arthrobacter sp. Hiyo8]
MGDISDENVLHFVRPGNWHVVANFGTAPVALPKGEVLLASADVKNGTLPGEATAWIRS